MTTANWPPPISASIEEKLAWTDACYTRRGTALPDLTALDSLLSDLRSALRQSHRSMRDVGLVDICGRCEQLEGGSCCGAGIEDRYDSITLLINRLLGVVLPDTRPLANSCWFLGDRGCLLLARDVICVNYLCAEAVERLEADRLATLRAAEGRELDTLCRLHRRIAQQLNR